MRRTVALLIMLMMFSSSQIGLAYKESDQLNGGQTTHQFIMDRVPIILQNDGYTFLSDFLTPYVNQMKYGSMRADQTIWDSREHYMDPSTHNGYLTFKSAGTLAFERFDAAVTHWFAGDKQSAFYDLGWSTHLVQDLTVPHHAYVTALNYHAEYEQWVYDNQLSYSVSSGGIYNFSSYLPGHYENELSPMDWVDYNAHFSIDYYPFVNGQNGQGDNDYAYAASTLLRRAQKTSAGYVYMFFSTVNNAPTLGEAHDKYGGLTDTFEFRPLGPKDDMGIISYTWEFGDGTFGYERNVTHSYSWPGVYLCNITVRDAFGLEATDQIEVQVRDDIYPVAVAGSDWVIPEGGTVHLDGSGSWDNIGITELYWSLGYSIVGNNTTLDYTFPEYGEYTFLLTVEDAADNWDSDYVKVTVMDMEPPVADAGPDLNVWVDRYLMFFALDSTDDNGIVDYYWDFGDGYYSGSNVTWHKYRESGTYTVTLQVTDVSGNTDTDTMVVRVIEPEKVTRAHPLGIVLLIMFIIADILAAILFLVVVRKYRKREMNDF